MSVEFRRAEPPAPPEKLAELADRVGVALPDDYIEFLSQHDGGRMGNNNETVKMVFGVGEVPDYASIWDALDTYDGRVPTWLIPAADDSFGNLFCLSIREQDVGSVWFWDHEQEADEDEPATEDNLTYKAKSWTEFLNQLRPSEP
ncbi:hypothetical protein Lfu02_00620 [Longispora fulva]|uniref:Knr4/Smi1-like domain-containing protein n=1 Tax=Longispora fulva TaxID=619741 RepID=A0A8J7KW35_9ACTN|nr:SMI1/KNR4 family protein [Longispora fulva]MBG6136067.1 hypothetical protein [Longispora fulva]GIG55690.1 hypothetical protein Lfu02_00620 [Longispora fulva]